MTEDYSAQKQAIYTQYAQGRLSLDEAEKQILAIGPRPNYRISTAIRLALVALLGIVAAFALTGCAASFRSVGMQDGQVEIVRALSATQASTIKALTDALTAAQKSACEVIR